MLTIKKITPDTENLAEIQRLYEQSFPKNERRPFQHVFTMPQESMEPLALYDGSVFCGFVCLLNGTTLSHIIYFAIEENLRNRGYGSMALQAIHAYKPNHRIIADLEFDTEKASNSEQRRKRKQFYLRNGYKETAIYYRWRKEDYEILSYGGQVTKEEFEIFWEQV